MKNYCAIIVLFLLCTQHTVFSMQNIKKEDLSEDWFDREDIKNVDTLQLQTTEQSFVEDQICNKATTTVNYKLFVSTDVVVALIDAIIYKKVTGSMNDQGIMNIVNEYSDLLREDIIKLLYQKNTYFKRALVYFNDLAFRNVANVSIDTLELVQDSTAVQPIALLNTLPPVIKKYVMKRSFSSLYGITLKGHTDRITRINCNSFGLCNQAVKNTHSLTSLDMIDKIEKSPTFQNLTECEKIMVTKSIMHKQQRTQTDKLLHNK